MAVLPRAVGEPEFDALEIVELIRFYATRKPSPNVASNVERIRGLHHIYDAARDYLDVGMAVVNTAPDGRVSCRKIESEIGIHKDSVVKHVHNGKRLLGDAA